MNYNTVQAKILERKNIEEITMTLLDDGIMVIRNKGNYAQYIPECYWVFLRDIFPETSAGKFIYNFYMEHKTGPLLTFDNLYKVNAKYLYKFKLDETDFEVNFLADILKQFEKTPTYINVRYLGDKDLFAVENKEGDLLGLILRYRK